MSINITSCKAIFLNLMAVTKIPGAQQLSNDMRLFDQLVAAGADVAIQPPDGTTLLHFAISSKKESFVEKLVDTYHLDVNAKNCLGYTPTHIAAIRGIHNTLKFLIDRNANFNEENIFGTTPLDFAKHIGNKECIRLLEIALGIRTLAEVAPPNVVLEDQNDSEEDNADEEYTAPTPAEETKYWSIEQQIHQIYQNHKAKLSEPGSQEAAPQSWVIKSINANPDEIYSESIKHSGEVFKVVSHADKATYFAIPDSLEEGLLAKFTTAIEKGFIGSHGKSGIKVFRKKISQHESIETLYELKIYSSQYGELRLYTKDKYINANGSELIVFKALGNHRDVALAARESNGIVEHRLESAAELVDQEPIGNMAVLDQIKHLSYLSEAAAAEEEIKCAGDL